MGRTHRVKLAGNSMGPAGRDSILLGKEKDSDKTGKTPDGRPDLPAGGGDAAGCTLPKDLVATASCNVTLCPALCWDAIDTRGCSLEGR
jgi:hypothetical protein